MTWLCKVSWDTLWSRRGCDPYACQGSKTIPFFQCKTRLGCHILAVQTTQVSAVVKGCHTYHFPHTIITKFWQKNWKQHHTRQITTFQWLLIHTTLLVGACQRENLSSPNCVACPNETESIRHALWECPETHWIWRGVATYCNYARCKAQSSGEMYVGYHGKPQLTGTSIRRRGWLWW